MLLLRKILVPAIIFTITLIACLLVRAKFIHEGGLYPVKHEWTVLSEGDSEAYSGVEDLFASPGAQAQLVLKDSAGVISKTHYSLNEFGLRDIGLTEKKDKHLLLSGCSFIFGLGIEENETLSSVLRNGLPEVNVRNLGFPGGGLHTALRFSEIVPLKKFVPEEEGTFLYVMFSDHLNRFLLRPDFLLWSRSTAPTYQVKDDAVVYDGKLNTHLSFWKSKVLNFLSLGGLEKSPESFTDRELEAYLDGVKELKKRYLKEFPRGKFLWMIHPLFPFRGSARLESLAVKKGIPLLGNPLQVPHKERPRYLLRDNHPNGSFNRNFANWIRVMY